MLLNDGHTAALRVVHVDNLEVYLRRGWMHAASRGPTDGLTWRGTHRAEVQSRRASPAVPLHPGGVLLDYVPFHFGPRNLFLFNLKTGRVEGYNEGQESLITLVLSVEDIAGSALPFVFLVWDSVPWALVRGIAVCRTKCPLVLHLARGDGRRRDSGGVTGSGTAVLLAATSGLSTTPRASVPQADRCHACDSRRCAAVRSAVDLAAIAAATHRRQLSAKPTQVYAVVEGAFLGSLTAHQLTI